MSVMHIGHLQSVFDYNTLNTSTSGGNQHICWHTAIILLRYYIKHLFNLYFYLSVCRLIVIFINIPAKYIRSDVFTFKSISLYLFFEMTCVVSVY